jgi:uncharacterized protein (DUF362 family)/ferredoxin
MKSKVAIVECPDYDQTNVEKAVHHGLELIGGLGPIVKPGNSVLLKVNALLDADPETGTTTHPSLVAALIKEIKKHGAKALVGDSPGNATADIEQTMAKTGFAEAAQQAGGEILNFQKSKITDVPSPSNNTRINPLKIAQAVLDCDVIINLPKLKTHGWTLYTGAIKNMFGVVPGFFKSRYHVLAPQPYQFSEMLVDILEVTQPKLHIMDAVMGMEGQGPSAGRKRFMGALFFSTDAVALDAVCSEAMGFSPFDIDTTKIADQRGLGTGNFDRIEIIGASLAKIAQKDWEHSANNYTLTRWIPAGLNVFLRPITKLLRIDPKIDQDKCKKCLICVENCPAKTIHVKNGKVEIDLSNCIMCFCCHELCPYQAIKLKRSRLTRMLGIAGPD